MLKKNSTSQETPDLGISTVNITDQLISDYLGLYAPETIERALPDPVDGLVQATRRILYVGHTAKINKLVKTMNYIGQVLARLHPHGDQSVHGSIQSLASTISWHKPLLDGQGNGKWMYAPRKVDWWVAHTSDDNPAAPRYTEVKVSDFTNKVIWDYYDERLIEKKQAYTGNEYEPVRLYPLLPLALLHNNTGIAVGYSHGMLAYDPVDIIDWLVNPSSLDNFPYPKPPTGGIIHPTNAYNQYLETGLGSITIEGEYKLSSICPKRTTHQVIRITALPPGISAEKIVTSIAEKSQQWKEYLKGVENYSDKNGILIEIVLKPKVKPEEVIPLLMNIGLRKTYPLRLLFAGPGAPITFSGPISYLEYFTNQVTNYLRKYAELKVKDLSKEIRKYTIFLYFLSDLLVNIDLLSSGKEAKLKSKLELSDEEYSWLIEQRISRLRKLDQEEISKKVDNLEEEMSLWKSRSNDPLSFYKSLLLEIRKTLPVLSPLPIGKPLNKESTSKSSNKPKPFDPYRDQALAKGISVINYNLWKKNLTKPPATAFPRFLLMAEYLFDRNKLHARLKQLGYPARATKSNPRSVSVIAKKLITLWKSKPDPEQILNVLDL